MAVSWIDKIFLPKLEAKEFTFKRYIKELENGEYRDRLVFGVLEDDAEISMADPVKSPNALYVGAMGSGKSKAAVFTTMTWMAANSDHSILFLVDPMKGASDYSELFQRDHKGRKPYKQVYEILSSSQQVIRLIDLLYDETMARAEEFNKINAESYVDYEKKTGKSITRLLTVMEEFHAIPYTIMDFHSKFKENLSTANKFHTLMRIGRSYGVFFIACSQKSTKSDIPPEMVPNFVNKNVFKVNRGEATYILGDTKAAEILGTQKGRCYTEYGATQFPMFDQKNDTEKRFLKKYVKPLTAESFYLNDKIIKDVLAGRSQKDQYKSKKLTDLVTSIESYNDEIVVTILHEKQGHNVEQLDPNIDDISHIVYWNNDMKIAIMTRCKSNTKKISGKHLEKLRSKMEKNECTMGILYTSDNYISAAAYKLAVKLGIEIVDHEDMIKMAYQVEKNGDKSNLSPDKLASDYKEDGSFQKEKNIKDDDSFNEEGGVDLEAEEESKKKKDENKVKKISEKIDSGLFIEDFKDDFDISDEEEFSLEESSKKLKTLESFLSEKDYDNESDYESDGVDVVDGDKEGETVTDLKDYFDEDDRDIPKDHISIQDIIPLEKGRITAPIKREKVLKYFSIRKEETPTLMIHFLRNEEGEVYRILFFTLDSNEIRNRFFIDKKINGNFSYQELILLGVKGKDEWNSQSSTLNEKDFDEEFIEYLENFKNCEMPVHTICWSKDAELVLKYISELDYMIKTPTIIEQMTKVWFGENTSREKLISDLKIDKKKRKKSLFLPLEEDLEIWKAVN